VHINRHQVTIVGVAPPEFHGDFPGIALDGWIPVPLTGESERDARHFQAIVRLKPGVGISEANAEVATVATRLALAFPKTNQGIGARIVPIWKAQIGAKIVLRSGARLAARGTIDTTAVHFTQNSIAAAYREGPELNQAIAALRAGGAEAAAGYDPIRLVAKDGKLWTLDNRRLLVFSQAGFRVPFRMATKAEIELEFAGKLTTTAAQGWGRFVTVRLPK